MDLKKLSAPFPADAIEWRVGQAGKGASGKMYAKVLAYLTSRAVMDRLDEVCGPENWKNEFQPGPSGGIICGLSIRCGIGKDLGDGIKAVYKDDWVTKWDGAENTDVEAIKGGLSDAMKRAAVQWGIGRYLYNLGETWAVCSDAKQEGWNYAKTKDGQIYYWQTPVLPAWALPSTK